MTFEKNEIKYVRWTIFCWTISIFIVVMGWLFVRVSNAENRVSSFTDSMTEIKTQLSQIQTDLLWIRDAIKK